MKKAPLFTLCFKLITLTIFLTLLVTTNQSFAQTPLIKYIKSNKYEPFTIPRTDWGVGTTITFKKGQEEIVAFNDNCLQLTPENTNSFIPNSTYEITNKNSFELNLGKLFGDKLNIEAAFKNKRVKKVVITVTDVKETVIPTILVSQKIEDFAKNNNKSCLNAIIDKKSLVIVRTLSIGSLSYSFVDDKNVQIVLDADFLKNIKMADSVSHKYNGKTELTIDKRAFIGYRVSQFKANPGLIKTTFTATAVLDPKKVELLRKSTLPK